MQRPSQYGLPPEYRLPTNRPLSPHLYRAAVFRSTSAVRVFGAALLIAEAAVSTTQRYETDGTALQEGLLTELHSRVTHWHTTLVASNAAP